MTAPLGQSPAAHHRLLTERLQSVADGRIRRLRVHMPPGSAKSTYASVLFPAWFLARRPQSSIIACAHTAALAEHFGRQVRDVIAAHAERLGVAVRGGGAAHLSTEMGGEYFATGVRGSIVGRRADLILLDDPVRSYAEADSARARDALWEWYRTDLISRLKPCGSVVLVMTRWHPDDLAGRLPGIDEAAPDSTVGRFHVVDLPAIAEEDDPLGRAPGAPLWPEWEDAEALARKRALVGERIWAALYQQRPRRREGGLFHAERVGVVEAEEAARLAGPARVVRGWDLAGSTAGKGDPDFTVGVKLARLAGGGFLVLDVVRAQIGAEAVERLILETAARDGRAVQISLPQDPGQAGRAQSVYLVRQLAGYHVHASPETGSKETRAMPAASQVEAGNVAVLRAPWNDAFLAELADFPVGAKDDQVDALSRAFMELAVPVIGVPARRAVVPLLGR